ncbi:hypothetical protein RRF57_003559 [Xylaria bambusicola]|uniref:Uncharacterized protein n=1 Tax=Xylaria bambusicola TaxID=326684 RepID=A0AAN7UUK8_9PEZI
MEEVEIIWSEFGILNQVARVIHAYPTDDVPCISQKSVVEPDYLSASFEAFEALDNQILSDLRHHGLKPGNTESREEWLQGLSSLAMEFMGRTEEMRTFEVESIGEAQVVVGRAYRTGHIEFIIVLGVANGELVRVNSHNRP